MKQNLRKKEFLTYFQMLKEQPNSSYRQAQFIELKKYVVFLFDFFIWKSKDLYLKLFISFANFNMSGDELVSQFFSLRLSHIKEFDQLLKELEINFKAATGFPVDSRAFGFQDIISRVYEDCEAFVSDELLEEIEDSRDLGDIDENELRTRVEEAILRIQKQSNKE